MSYLINGAAGKTLDATARTPASLLIESCSLKFASLADDELTWTAGASDSKGTGTIIPDAGQVVELWVGGARKFRGWAVAPKTGIKTVQVTVTGPWWWLRQIPISSVQTDATAATADRTSYIFPTQSLKTSITALLTRAALQSRDNPADAATAKFTVGTIATMFSVPKITLSNMDFGSALAELMRWCPDAVCWVDYSGTGLPAVNVTRRGTYTPVTLTVGTDAVEIIDIAPRIDLQVSSVDLNYVTRQATTGLPEWAVQSYGTAAAGKRQMVPISGPEIAAILPKDDFETIQVQTIYYPSITAAMIIARDSQLAAIQKSIGGVFGAWSLGFVNWTGISTGPKIQHTWNFPGMTVIPATDGMVIPGGTNYLVISPDPLPDWAQKSLRAIEVTLSGTWIAEWSDSVNGVGSEWSPGYMAMQAGAILYNNGYENGSIVPPTNNYRADYLARPFSVHGWIIPYSIPALLDIYKAWDYDYLTPPANLAQNLLACQSFVPYEGTVGIVAQTASCDNSLGTCLNLANCRTEYASMAAMKNTVTYDLLLGRTSYGLGTPARTDFGSLVARVRRDPQDNIVYL